MFSSAWSSKPHLAQPEYVIIGREARTHSSEVSAWKMSCLYWPVEIVNFSCKTRAFTWITPIETTISNEIAISFIDKAKGIAFYMYIYLYNSWFKKKKITDKASWILFIRITFKMSYLRDFCSEELLCLILNLKIYRCSFFLATAAVNANIEKPE